MPGPGAAAPRDTRPVLGVPVDVIGWDAAVERIMAWGRDRVGRATYLCNVHVAVTASRDPQLARALAEGDLVLPDGAPVAWMQRRLGAVGQSRIDGPNLMGRVCAAAERDGVPIYLLGGSPAALATLERELVARFSRLRIAGSCSPPYRDLTDDENARLVTAMNDSNASVARSRNFGSPTIGRTCGPSCSGWARRSTSTPS